MGAWPSYAMPILNFLHKFQPPEKAHQAGQEVPNAKRKKYD